MSRYMGSLALEYWAYRHIIRTTPEFKVYKHPRGWPAIELPNPDASWEVHQIHSKRTYAWIRSKCSTSIHGSIVLTEGEVKLVASLLAADAYLNAAPILMLPLEPTTRYEPILEAVVHFMLHGLKVNGKSRYDDSMTSFRNHLTATAEKLGLTAKSIPSKASWLGRIMRTLIPDLRSCGIRAIFYRKDMARFVTLEWITLPPPQVDGKDDNLTSSSSSNVIPNVQPAGH